MAKKEPSLDAFLRSVGITPEAGMFWPVFEDNYIKFMSDGGKLDDKQGDQFERWLKKKKLPYERTRKRSFTLGGRATAAVYDLWGEEPKALKDLGLEIEEPAVTEMPRNERNEPVFNLNAGPLEIVRMDNSLGFVSLVASGTAPDGRKLELLTPIGSTDIVVDIWDKSGKKNFRRYAVRTMSIVDAVVEQDKLMKLPEKMANIKKDKDETREVQPATGTPTRVRSSRASRARRNRAQG